jgi:hypothetical protein
MSLTFPILKLMMEHSGFKILQIEKDKEKKEEDHLEDTLSPRLIMVENTLIVMGEKII